MPSNPRKPPNPVLTGQPVVIVHLGMDEWPNRTACTGELFTTSENYPNIPRVMCMGCARHVPPSPEGE